MSYLVSSKHPEIYDVVCEDLGYTELPLSNPRSPNERVRVFLIEPGNDSCGNFYRVLSERQDGSLYTVLENGEVVEVEFLEELVCDD